MCSSSDDLRAIVWDYASGSRIITEYEHPQVVYGSSFCTAGNHQKCLATCCFDLQTRIYDVASGKKPIARFSGHTSDIVGLDFNGEHLLATGADDGHIFIYDLRTTR